MGYVTLLTWVCIYIAFFFLICRLSHEPLAGKQKRSRDKLARNLGKIALQLQESRQFIISSRAEDSEKIHGLEEVGRIEQTLPELKRQWLMAVTCDDLLALRVQLIRITVEIEQMNGPYYSG